MTLPVFYLGIDFGTSAARAIAIDEQKKVCVRRESPFSRSAPDWAVWQRTLFGLLEKIPQEIRVQLKVIAINGTSATVLLCDAQGKPVTQPLMYNDGRGVAVLDQLKQIAPPNHPVLSATSSLAKLIWWSSQSVYQKATYFLHQADWLAFLLHGRLGISDYHNALKLGYDVEQLSYPDWLKHLAVFPLLPQVLSPGTPVGEVTAEIAQLFNFPADCFVCTGTTDSIAAFLASGAREPGEAVTSLGSTLVLKLLSRTRVEESRSGIYSHRLGDLWLAGGASNTGGAVLRHFFSDEELARLSERIDPRLASPLDYYPLLTPGDRFPINDPQLSPKLTPRPDDPVQFLHGLLESMARIEAQGYRLLQNWGATALTQVYTAGGGAKNLIWSRIRSRCLSVPVEASVQTAAAYGSALLARQSDLVDDGKKYSPL